MKHIVAFFLIFSALAIPGATLGAVVFSEIAWMGTEASASDEWIELYNPTSETIVLLGWGIYEAVGETLIEELTGTIPAESYYLIERTDDETLPSITASQKPTGWGGHGLKNSGEHLQLIDIAGIVVDDIDARDGWPAGDNASKHTMELQNGIWVTSTAPGGTPEATEYASETATATASLSDALRQPLKRNGSDPWIFFFAALTVSLAIGTIAAFLKHRI